ncbi:hypothetical protein JTE90_025494 [Oedothorax gibbosus]|uniref:Uncharacterized protein n=1 Tax=Oedothorax gibbosus TaxID=931172 RepID=A0AAV6UZ85_9ARAC|nr:hypothetical protein JTE90_025494 [Oedothorax gibbosus]
MNTSQMKVFPDLKECSGADGPTSCETWKILIRRRGEAAATLIIGYWTFGSQTCCDICLCGVSLGEGDCGALGKWDWWEGGFGFRFLHTFY